VVNWGNSFYGQVVEPQGKAVFSRRRRSHQRAKPTLPIYRWDFQNAHDVGMFKAWSADDDDWRGDIHNDDGEFRFHTR